MGRTIVALLLGCVVLLAGAAPASAVQKNWVGPFGGEWNEAGNWSPAGVPGPGDEANFGSSGTQAAVSGSDASVGRIVGPQATVAIQGVKLTIAGAGDGGDLARFQVTEGGTLAVTGTAKLRAVSLGETSGDSSTGTIEVDGIVRQDGSITEAAAALGRVTIESGGLWTVDPTAQSVIQARFENDGAVVADHMDLTVAAGSPASGGSFDLAGRMRLVLPEQSPFELTSTSRVVGTGELDVQPSLFGTTSTAKVDVAQGATFELGKLRLLGTTFENGTDARAGWLDALGGALISGSGSLTLTGPAESAVGLTTFSGPGTTTFDGNVVFTASGLDPVATIHHGARVRVNGSTQLGQGVMRLGNTGGSGVLEVDGPLDFGQGFQRFEDHGGGLVRNLAGGVITVVNRSGPFGTFVVGGKVPVENAGVIDIGPRTLFGTGEAGFGTLTQTAGETRVAGGLLRQVTLSGGRLIGNGSVRSLANTGGTVEPGVSPGTLTVTTDYTQSAGGTLRTEIAGTTPGSQHDRLVVGGTATLGGTLAIAGSPQFTPQLTDTFTILTGDTRTGTFTTVTGAQAGPRRYLVQYASQAVELCVAEGSASQCGASGGDDADGDGVPDPSDNCVDDPNPTQEDSDDDGQGDVCDPDDDNDGHSDAGDNCPINANPGQEDNEGDGDGDVCDPDDDNDHVADGPDNCNFTANEDQEDADSDGIGDVCDTDADNDGDADDVDNCPSLPNPGQENIDSDPEGDACDADDDNDGVADTQDNCRTASNPGQVDRDGDETGDACDGDDDGDGTPDEDDNCVQAPNSGQQDADRDGAGDACDADDDADGRDDAADNCPLTANPGQEDGDSDGIGDSCDARPTAEEQEPVSVESITPTPPAKAGGAMVATAGFSGPVQRLEWNLDRDPAPDIVVKAGGVVAGDGQRGAHPADSVRFRPLEGLQTISVRGVGADGNSDTTSLEIRGQAPQLSTPIERRIDRKVDHSDPVYVAGDLEDLTRDVARCGSDDDGQPPLRAGALDVRGCFNPVTDLSSLPKAERGIVYRVAQQYSIPTSQLVKPISNEIISWQPMLFVLDLSDVYVSYAPVRVNGVDIRPAPGAAIIVAPQANTIATSNGRIYLGDMQLDTPRGFTLDTTPRTGGGAIPLGRFPRLPNLPSIAGFKLTGDVDVNLTPGSADNGGADITVRLELPEFFRIGGGKAVAEARLRATSDEGLVLDTLNIGPLDLSMGGVGIRDLKIDYTRATEEWKGQAKACVIEDACLDMTERADEVGATFPGGVIIRRGRLVRAGATLPFPDPGLPLAPGVNLSHIGFFVGLDPTRFGGEAGIKIGQLVRIDGRLVLAFPTAATPWVFNREEAGPAFPAHFYGREHTNFTLSVGANLYLLVPIVGEVELARAYFMYEYPGYVAFGGGIDARLLIISFMGRIDGEFNASNGRFSLVGQIEACIADVVCGGAVAAVSSGGAGGCVKVGPLSMGGGVQWRRVSEPFLWPGDGCKWSRFIEPNVRGKVVAAQAGSPHVVTVEPGEPARMVRFEGAEGAPRVRVRGPGGVDFESPEGPGYSVEQDIRIMRSEQFKQTVVGLTRPGRYEIEPLDGSPAVSRLTEAEEQPDAKATARVHGSGAQRTLEYNVRPREGQRVTFIESAGDRNREIGTITGGGRGELKFDSAPGDGFRRIEAQFELEGVPAERLPIAQFSATPPKLARPKRLKVKRRGDTLLLTRWTPVPGATRYEVVTTLSGGRQRIVRTRGTTRRLRVGAVDGGRVDVRALAEQRQGPRSSARFKATKRLRTRADKLPRPPREPR